MQVTPTQDMSYFQKGETKRNDRLSSQYIPSVKQIRLPLTKVERLAVKHLPISRLQTQTALRVQLDGESEDQIVRVPARLGNVRPPKNIIRVPVVVKQQEICASRQVSTSVDRRRERHLLPEFHDCAIHSAEEN